MDSTTRDTTNWLPNIHSNSVGDYVTLVDRYAAPRLHPPFNLEARRRAGFTQAELEDLEGGV